MTTTETETPIWGDELEDYIDIGTAAAPNWIEATNLLAFEFDGDQQTYEPSYINRRTPKKYVLGETASISYEKDMYRNNELDEFLAAHEDEADIPVRVCRVRKWEPSGAAFGAKMGRFSLTPNQLDKNTAGEPVKLKGTLTMQDEVWTKGTFNPATLTFTAAGGTSATPETPTTPKSLDEMTVEELKAYAAENSIDITGKTLKADTLAAIKAAEATEVTEDTE